MSRFIRYRITNVPEVTIFRNGLPHPYKGPSEDAGAQGEYVQHTSYR